MPVKQSVAPTISFKAKLSKIGSWTILQLPGEVSTKLPSRGQVMVEGTISGIHFQTPLEPDGKGSHWFRIDKHLSQAAHLITDDTAAVKITLVKDWPEPVIPADWQQALAGHAHAQALWQRVTPMARWEWIRWARATSNSETRKRRIEVGMSKLADGERRPCCWNRNLCTEPSVSKNGVLLESA